MTDKHGANLTRRNLLKVAAGAGVLTTLAGAAPKVEALSHGLALDVCCNGRTVSFQGPTFPDGMPNYGATFVVEGVIYPDGTLRTRGVTRGLYADGSPEYPNLVMGKWTCYGTFVGQGARTPAGQASVVTSQIYDLAPDRPGEKILMSTGYELEGFNIPFRRVLIGATGVLGLGLGAEVVQEAIGPNETGFPNIHFQF